MRCLKKFLSIFIVITILAGVIVVPVSAASSFVYEDEAWILYRLGLFKGVSETRYEPNLGATLERQEGAVLVLRLFRLEEEANKMNEEEAKRILKEKFKDADEVEGWAVKAIAYAVQNGIIHGKTDGTFAPKDKLIGKEFAKMILEQLGQPYYFATACADLAAISDLTPREAINFNEKPLTRDDAVGISYATLNAIYADSGKTVLAVLSEDPDFRQRALEVGLVKVVKILDEFEQVVIKVGGNLNLPSRISVEYSDGSTERVAVDWDYSDVRTNVVGEYLVIGKVDYYDGRIIVPVTVEEDELKVESVSADNLKQITVVFNQDVSENVEVANKDNYKLDIAKKIEKVKVDGNIVILDVENSGNDIPNQKKVVLTISGKILEKEEKFEFTFFDATLPEVISMEVTGPKRVNITFSEPIATYGKITLKSGNSTLSVNTSFSGKGTNEISIPLYSTFVDGRTYEITIRDFKDFAGYANIIKTFEFLYEKDETPPVATVKEVTQKYVKVSFSKPVNGLTKDHFSHTFSAWTSIGLTTTDVFKTSGDTVVKPTDSVKEVYVWFYNNGLDKENERAIPEGKTTFRIRSKTSTSNYEIKDEWGNKLGDVYFEIEVTSDKMPPEVSKIEVVDEDQIKIVFTKEVTFTKDNIEVLDTDGKKIDGVKIRVLEEGTGKEFNVTLGKKLAGKLILVNIEGVEDTSLNNNKMIPYSEVIEITDKTPPEIYLVTYDDTYRKNETYLYVFFDEAVDYESALQVSNYYIYDGSTYTRLTGEASFFSGEKIVRITLSDKEYTKIKNLKGQSGRGLFVVNVKDLAGTEIIPKIKKIDGPQSTANRPEILENTVKATAPDRVEFLFNQELSSVEISAFRINTNKSNVTYTIIGMDTTLENGKTKVILTVEGEERVSGTRKAVSLPYDAEGITLELDGDKVTNLFGDKGADKTGIAIEDKIAPEVKEIVAGSGDKEIYIKFAEKLYASLAHMYCFDLVITDEDDDELIAGIHYETSLTDDGKTIVVKIKNGNYGEYTVGPEETFKYIMDLKYNLAASFDEVKVKIEDEKEPEVIQPITSEIGAGGNATIIFSEPLKSTSKTTVENAIRNADKAGVNLEFTWNSEGSRLTVRNKGSSSTNFKNGKDSVKVEVTVTDLEGNSNLVTIINIEDETGPSLVSDPIKGEIRAGGSAQIKFSESIIEESKEVVENAIKDSITSADAVLDFEWKDNNSTLNITNYGTKSTNFIDTLISKDSNNVTVEVKDLKQNSSRIDIITISEEIKEAVLEAKDAVEELPQKIKDAETAAEAQEAIDAAEAKVDAVLSLDANYDTSLWDGIIAENQIIVNSLKNATKAVEDAENAEESKKLEAVKDAEELLAELTDERVAKAKNALQVRIDKIRTAEVRTAKDLEDALNNEVITKIIFKENITTDKHLYITRSNVVIDGKNDNGENFKLIASNNIVKDQWDRNTILTVEAANGVKISNLIIDASAANADLNDQSGSIWDNLYVLQVFNSKDVELNNLTLIGGDAGLLVNSAEVTVVNITTKNNQFGGIEVSKSSRQDVNLDPKLTIKGTSVHEDEDGTPHIWIDGKTTNNDGGEPWVIDQTGIDETGTYNYTKVVNEGGKQQLWFFNRDPEAGN